MAQKDSTLTQDRLKELLHYCPETGVFTWLIKPYKQPMNVGDVAGSKSKDNQTYYISIKLNKKSYKAHRLAFLYMTGAWPRYQIDHDDGNGLNNKWLNLNDATAGDNQKNRRRNKNNKSGLTGVFFDTQSNKLKAQIKVNSVNMHLGYFIDFFEACCARKSAENKHNFHVNHGVQRLL